MLKQHAKHHETLRLLHSLQPNMWQKNQNSVRPWKLAMSNLTNSTRGGLHKCLLYGAVVDTLCIDGLRTSQVSYS